MTIKINTPNIGADELEVTEIMVKIGDKVSINQPLIVIEGDKSSIEIPAPCSGTVTEIHIQVGTKVHTGSLILSLNNIEKNTKISNINYQNDTTESTVDFIPTQDIRHNTEDCKVINHRNVCINLDSNKIIHATPLIRHMARIFGVNLSKIQGTGRKGRILKEDIHNYLNKNILKKEVDYTPTISLRKLFSHFSLPEIDFSKFGNVTIITLDKIRKISGVNLHRNWVMAPHVTQFDEVDITDLEIFRKQQNIELAKNTVDCKITLLIFVIKAVAKALEEFPRFNSSLSDDGQKLILKDYINIGVAVDTPKGLLVPVLREVNKKGVISLSKELSNLSKKARSNNQLTPSDMQGGSFTISNLGGIGGSAFTPIINMPEVAILGISKAIMKPIWIDKKFVPRLMLPLSLSYDHRVIDGADGARFITLINNIISDIRLLSL
ncbi:2-oxo acid dehydrogenase subunit E2 [Candidatus Blochmannia ocreatus (nom. nud.)]|uniref:Dihydrolipoamide acetyltransferase component of pyruvate dehydrogenase complex n=1 Tax=Candidatus Blochmannia ocreatus (nom. nud.) TaxID=251538 RepID=A0ABY4SZG7_9ENTR|nr:2-oxo acid dehydrogenase subunit E2 [Candidatus Blochmannia ocreatus]URJ25234.1 2-oxo acid dehydrogenase subunit E2 [Candidatus Blochmannia ocreatus]